MSKPNTPLPEKLATYFLEGMGIVAIPPKAREWFIKSIDSALENQRTQLEEEWDRRESMIIAAANAGAQQNLTVWKAQLKEKIIDLLEEHDE